MEREAQDDPFLMDAIAGYESAETDQQQNLAQLDNLLQKRIALSKTRRLIPWKYISAAASLVLILCIAYLLWPGTKNALLKTEQMVAKTSPPVDHKIIQPDTAPKLTADNTVAAVSPQIIKRSRQAIVTNANPALNSGNANDIRIDEPVGNSDSKTVVEQAAPVAKNKQPINTLAKKLPGIHVDSAGNITVQHQFITKTRLNGKDAFGNDIKQATKNLPADVIEKTQATDDYGDKAARSAMLKPKKDTTALKEVTIVGYGAQVKKDVTASIATVTSQPLKSKVEGAEVTTPNKVSGRVLDELGLPLPGVTVQVVGTQKGTVTDVNGRFSLPTPGNATLSINYIGFESKRVSAKGNDSLNIKLKPNTNSLAEVVVGYGQAKAEEPIEEAHPRMGWDNYNKYLKKGAIADDGKTGVVRLTFTVGEKGELSNFKIIKSLSEENDKQAIDLVKNGPPWEADISGKPKMVKLKIHFSKD